MTKELFFLFGFQVTHQPDDCSKKINNYLTCKHGKSASLFQNNKIKDTDAEWQIAYHLLHILGLRQSRSQTPACEKILNCENIGQRRWSEKMSPLR